MLLDKTRTGIGIVAHIQLKGLLKTAVIVVAAFNLTACKLNLEPTLGGRIVTASGSVSCEPGESCVVDIADASFNETFMAQPYSGYEFVRWKEAEAHYCGGSSEDCVIDLRILSSLDDVGELFAATADADFFLVPEFRALQNQQPPEPIANLPMDGGLTDTVSGAAGELFGAVAWQDRNRNSDSALLFYDPTSNAPLYDALLGTYAQIDLPLLPTGRSPRTIAFFARAGLGSTMLSYGGSHGTDVRIAMTPQLAFCMGGRCLERGRQTALDNAYNDGRWHHFAISFDSITASIYIDGVAAGEFTPGELGDEVTPLRLGSIRGSLDELVVYDAALPASTIAELAKGWNPAASAADIHIDSITSDTETAERGSNIVLDVAISNTGNLDMSGYLNFYVSEDASISATDTLVGSANSITFPTLTGGASTTKSVTWVNASAPSAEVYIGVCADYTEAEVLTSSCSAGPLITFTGDSNDGGGGGGGADGGSGATDKPDIATTIVRANARGSHVVTFTNTGTAASVENALLARLDIMATESGTTPTDLFTSDKTLPALEPGESVTMTMFPPMSYAANYFESEICITNPDSGTFTGDDCDQTTFQRSAGIDLSIAIVQPVVDDFNTQVIYSNNGSVPVDDIIEITMTYTRASDGAVDVLPFLNGAGIAPGETLLELFATGVNPAEAFTLQFCIEVTAQESNPADNCSTVEYTP